MRATGNTVLVLIAAATLLFFLTDGLNAFTSEGARRYRVERQPLPLPHVQLTDTDGEAFSIGDFHGKTLLVDFIFTYCTEVCPLMTERFLDLQQRLQAGHLREQVALLTISFDPARDTLETLSDYARAADADTTVWKFAMVSEREQLPMLLDAFGIVAIATPNGQFEHNAAIHRVDATGRLVKIYDYTATPSILHDLDSLHGNL